MRVVVGVFVLLFQFSALGSWENRPFHVASGCRILGPSGFLYAQLPGNLCQFFEDGSFVSVSPSGLRLIKKDKSVAWELPGHFHHQLNFSVDKKRLLVLGSVATNDVDRLREDRILVVSLEGKILAEARMSQFIAKEFYFPPWPAPEGLGEYRGEVTHLNSIYEVPKLRAGYQGPLREGDLVVNGLEQGIFVLSPDLKALKLRVKHDGSYRHHVHDVRPQESGKLLLFNNRASFSNQSSRVELLDPVTRKFEILFQAEPAGVFYSERAGGAHFYMDDYLVVSPFHTGTFIYDLKKKKILATFQGTYSDLRRVWTIQQARLEDLTLFLKNFTAER